MWNENESDDKADKSDNMRSSENEVTSRNAALSNLETFQSECEPECNNSKVDLENDVLLLYQSEYNYAGMDYIYRRCSFLPPFCPSNLQTLLSSVCSYGYRIGDINSTIDCFYDPNKRWVIHEKRISQAKMINAILWPLIGILVSIVCCVGFWRRNYKHISRLYIYNSWSAT